MPRKIKVAAIQMDATPAQVSRRLERAADLIAEAASAGAQLIALPEVFNTGYEYTPNNYPLAERIDGQTVTWMKTQAATHKIYLVGSLMLLDEEDVYNAALLIAPDGRTWRYDKQYPFLWERAYFREGNRITIADTDLGKLGMMICWDSAHNELWRRYAGKVDAMLVISSPPRISSADVVFADGARVNVRELGSFWSRAYTKEEYFPGLDLDAHAAWMRVPVIQTVGGGKFRSPMPMPLISAASYVASRSDLWSKLLRAGQVMLETGFDKQTKIVDASGQAMARVADDGDGFAVAEIELADETPHPGSRPPRMRTFKPAYFLADIFGPGLLTRTYRRGVRRQWGKQMAPMDTSTKVWGGVTLGALVLGWLNGLSGRDKKRRR